MVKSYSKTYHRWNVALKPTDATYPASMGGKTARGTDFEGEPDMDTTDWEGHTGTKTIKLGSDRTSVTSEPEFEQKLVFGECAEEYFFMLLGNVDNNGTLSNTPTPTTLVQAQGDTVGIYEWNFAQNLTNPTPIPKSTIVNTYNVAINGTAINDSIIYDNCTISELELNIDDDGVTIHPTWRSDAPIINQPNPVTSFGEHISKIGTGSVEFYMADFGTNLNEKTNEQLALYKYDCLVSASNTFNTNLDDFTCLGSEFGANASDEGNFEMDGEAEIIWNEKSQHLIDKWYTGEANGTHITQESQYQEVLIRLNGKTLNDDYTELFEMYFPKVELMKAWSDLSGDDTKTINVEYNLAYNGSVSPVKVKFISNTDELTYGVPTQPS